MRDFVYGLKCIIAWALGHRSEPDRPLRVRSLYPADEALTFAWRSDPEVIAAAVYQKAPTLDEHAAWMWDRLSDSMHRTFIVERDDRPVGMFTITTHSSERCSLGYMIAPEFRGLGLAKLLRAEAVAFVRSNTAHRVLDSRIRVENIRSIKTALRAGARQIREPEDGFIRFEQALS